MRHIRQINSVGTDSYTIVIAEEPLENHPSVIEHPELFEISEDEIPEKHQYVNPSYVIDSVKNMQLRLALIDFGIMPSAVDSAINAMETGAIKETFHTLWNYAVIFERNDDKLISMATVLGLTSEQTDALFRLANTK
jgi:hypothetical protein